MPAEPVLGCAPETAGRPAPNRPQHSAKRTVNPTRRFIDKQRTTGEGVELGRHDVLRAFGAAGIAALAFAGCTAPEASAPPPPHAAIGTGPHPTALLEIEGLGTVHIDLLPEISPQAVARFTRIANSGFYDGTTFHRVLPGFVIQGGDPLTRNTDPRDDGKGGHPEGFPDEFSGFAHLRGTLALANKGRPGTATGQFFIVHQDAPDLDGNYTVLGRVAAGIEVVDAVTELEIDTYGRYGPANRPYPHSARITSLRVAPVPES